MKGKEEAENICSFLSKFWLSFMLLLLVFYNHQVKSHLLHTKFFFLFTKGKKENPVLACMFRNFRFYSYFPRLLIKLLTHQLSDSCSLVYHFLVHQFRSQTGWLALKPRILDAAMCTVVADICNPRTLGG